MVPISESPPRREWSCRFASISNIHHSIPNDPVKWEGVASSALSMLAVSLSDCRSATHDRMKIFGKKSSAENTSRSAVVGRWGEDQAAKYLKKIGCKIFGRNVRPDRRDEIDIIARHENTLIFVEVKTRKHEDFGSPASAVDIDKRHALNRAAAAYLRRTHYPDLFYRFDVVEVIGQPEDKEPEIRHITDAFPFEKRFKFPV